MRSLLGTRIDKSANNGENSYAFKVLIVVGIKLFKNLDVLHIMLWNLPVRGKTSKQLYKGWSEKEVLVVGYGRLWLPAKSDNLSGSYGETIIATYYTLYDQNS